MSFPLSPSRPRLVVLGGAEAPHENEPPGRAEPKHRVHGLASLTIDGLSDSLFNRIVESAAANHRSIVGEVIARLEMALGSSRPPSDSMLARVRAVRNRMAVAHVNGASRTRREIGAPRARRPWQGTIGSSTLPLRRIPGDPEAS
jgi:antitoxin FitA